MPRRTKPQDVVLGEVPPLVMLPPARKHGKHEHQEDPYETLPGAVPKTVTTSTRPLQRERTATDLAQQQQARELARARGQRYDQYLDVLASNGGDTDAALALVFGVTVEEAHVQRYALLTEVRAGIGRSSLSDLLEQHDLTLKARVKVYSKHVYSGVPAASLKALQEIGELEGESSDAGSFESYLRLAKAQTP